MAGFSPTTVEQQLRIQEVVVQLEAASAALISAAKLLSTLTDPQNIGASPRVDVSIVATNPSLPPPTSPTHSSWWSKFWGRRT